jgi:hypothetical protein
MDTKMLLVRRKPSLIPWPSPEICIHNGDREKSLGSVPPVQYLNNRTHGQNLSSTSAEAEPFVQYFFENWTTDSEEGGLLEEP